MLLYVNENSEGEPNLMPQPLDLYLSGSAFRVSFTDLNKHLFHVKSMFKFLTMDLVCRKYVYLLTFQGYKQYQL